MLIASQQGLMLREAVIRERVRNKRRIFDEWLYERANTPTLEQLRQEALALEWSRSGNDPPVTEIYSGRSLNTLLNGLVKVQGSGGDLRPIRLSEDILKHMNVISTQQGGNFGLLKDGGKLEWPVALVDLPPEEETAAQRKQIESLITEAIAQVGNKRIDVRLLKGLRGDVETFRKQLKKNVHDLSFPEYTEAKRFLHHLDDAITVLARPDAAKYVNGTYSLASKKIQTVQDLVRFMGEHGLSFAPSVSGDEPAYVALQRALAHGGASAEASVASKPGDQ